MATLYDLNQTTLRGFGDFNIKLIRSRDPRWVPVVALSTILSPVAINLPPVLLTIGVAPTYLSLIGNSRIAIFPCSNLCLRILRYPDVRYPMRL